MAKIGNGKLNVVVFLPDKKRGYYRSSRFDWAGIVGCASLNGHTFFGEWFDRYAPTNTDAVTGPAEEFRRHRSEIGYDEAEPGGLFLKIGVGLLRRIDNSPYRFATAYPIVDSGRWTVRTDKRFILFRQELHSSIGYAYVYEKVLSIDRHANVMNIEHTLTNTGSKPIDTEVYNHDFFMVDHRATGPPMEVEYRFAPVPDRPFTGAARVDGNRIRFVSPMKSNEVVKGYITGYSPNGPGYDMTFKDGRIGIEQSADVPMVRSFFWATTKVVCPEAYIGIHVMPGKTQHWTIHYGFSTTR